MLLAFPNDGLVIAVWIGRHSRDEDLYQELSEALGFERQPAGGYRERDRPACCEDGEPPILDEVTRQLLEAIRG